MSRENCDNLRHMAYVVIQTAHFEVLLSLAARTVFCILLSVAKHKITVNHNNLGVLRVPKIKLDDISSWGV